MSFVALHLFLALRSTAFQDAYNAGIALSPDEKTFAIGNASREVRLVRFSDGRVLRSFRCADAQFLTKPAFSPDGKYLTAAGVSAGIDGGLHLAQRLVGDEAAGLIMRGLEYEPDPPLDPIDWDPAVVEAVRPIWRPALDEVVAAHPYLAKPAQAPARAG